MQVKEKFQALVKEARLYSSQGLFDEARSCLEELARLVQTLEVLRNREAILADIQEKLAELDEKIAATSEKNEKRTFTTRESELVNTLLPDTEETPPEMRLDKARLLARYGSYTAAITLFSVLLKKKEVRDEAAIGLITAMVKDEREKEAADLLRKWEQQGLLEEKSLARCRSLVPAMASGVEAFDDEEMELLPVSSVGIRLENVPENPGEQVELDVSFQSGNLVSLIISSKDRKLIEDLQVGLRLNDMRCYSPVAVFRGSGIVASKHQIDSGPKKGDWCLNIEIKT